MIKKVCLFSLIILQILVCQGQQLWHNKERLVHYLPQGTNFVCVNSTMRFNRALYGTNTAFRVEAGDLPEFAMYMPGMGGNLQFGLLKNGKTKWLIKADSIKTIYKPGCMLYQIRDTLLEDGVLNITILALSNAEGMVLKITTKNVKNNVQLVWVYGGATGKKFSRDGDIGADPESSFYLKPENCIDNSYQLTNEKFILTYGAGKVLTEDERYEIQTKTTDQLKGEVLKKTKQITGYFPPTSIVKMIDAGNITTAFNDQKAIEKNYCISGKIFLKNNDQYFLLHNTATPVLKNSIDEFADAETARKKISSQIVITTPDKYINTLGGALSIAADAIWEEPTFMHGAIAWRMRLNGWRGAYTADALGWHDRARKHFDAYAKSQLTNTPNLGVVMDTALNLARGLEKIGTNLFSSGYITRNPNGYVGAHHYDMNLVFVDQLLNHFNYTGDLDYVKEMWPLLKRHLAWEKKNFDVDGDGLYDAYAAIWASDALQYSGGGVTHSSAYNYRANTVAAQIAKLIGEDGKMYEEEALKILKAINDKLWMNDKGWYAEYKDLLGNKLVHPSAGLWTVYHAIDSKITNSFQAYQSLNYIDNHIPHIPVIAKGWNEKKLFLLSETNWQPYTWSLNNVVLAENIHTALAYWQGNRKDDAFKLWRSAILETMYLSAGPGNFEQLSFYDAIRGELYRDFADGIGMISRSVMEGLFGIMPNALQHTLLIKPGFPKAWNHASVETPNIKFLFKRSGSRDEYLILPKYKKQMNLHFIIPAFKDGIKNILVNKKPVKWKLIDDEIGCPSVEINVDNIKQYTISIEWMGNDLEIINTANDYSLGSEISLSNKKLLFLDVKDDQNVITEKKMSSNSITGNVTTEYGRKSETIFVKVQQGIFKYWLPVNIKLEEDAAITPSFLYQNGEYSKIDLTNYFNDDVKNIFKNKYLSPRPVSHTMQLPTNGIGNWAYNSLQVTINDTGLRKLAAQQNDIVSFKDVSYSTPSNFNKKNIVFTSLWDNYPDSVVIPLAGKFAMAKMMVTGTTNPMQSRIVNGQIIFNYTNGSSDTFDLSNPQSWWPIEQDYYTDGYAFTTNNSAFTPDSEKPLRISLKTGSEITTNYKYTSIKGFTNFAIDGGAATILSLPLNDFKELQSVTIKTIANDVIIGVMALTLIRE